MKAKVGAWETRIFLNGDEIRAESLCNIGKGSDTCIWLVVSGDGFECTCLHKSPYLVKRFEAGETTAKKDGCEFVANLRVQELGEGEHTLNPLEDKSLES